MGLVDAIWVGPSGYTLPDGTVLERGETVCSLSSAEAEGSDNWHPVPVPDKDKDKSKTTGTTN